MKLIKISFNNFQRLFFPYPIPKFFKPPQQSSLFLNFFKFFQSSKPCMIRFGKRFPDICSEKLSNFEQSSQSNIKIKAHDYLLKNQQYLNYSLKKFKLPDENFVGMLLFLFFFLFLQQTTCVHFKLQLSLCTIQHNWKI